MRREISNRDWFGKACAGVICGYLIALGVSGLFKYLADAGPALYSIEGRVSIQIFPIVWSPIVAFCFLFGSTRQAWGWLGLSTALLWILLFMLGVAR